VGWSVWGDLACHDGLAQLLPLDSSANSASSAQTFSSPRAHRLGRQRILCIAFPVAVGGVAHPVALAFATVSGATCSPSPLCSMGNQSRDRQVLRAAKASKSGSSSIRLESRLEVRSDEIIFAFSYFLYPFFLLINPALNCSLKSSNQF